MSKKNIQKDRPDLLESQRIILIHGDGREGYPEEAPYDCMYIIHWILVFFFYLLQLITDWKFLNSYSHVGAAADETPDALINQLKAPGR